MALRDYTQQLRDLRGQFFQRTRAAETRAQPTEAERTADEAEEVERKILHAAHLNTVVRRNAGAGWFPGDPL